MVSAYQTTNLQISSQQNPERAMNVPNSFAVVAHDLRNPLACIVSSLELLDAKDGERGNGTEMIIRRGLRAASRIDDMLCNLLDEMRSQHEARTWKNASNSLQAIVKVAVDANLSTAERKSISITVKGGNIPFELSEDLLLEALDNLLSNAVKYSPRNSEVICEIIEGQDRVAIQISDHGQGLTADDLARIGRPYETLSATPTGGERRMGLGLWAVARIAKMLGAEFSASSDGVDQGATFSLCFPNQSHASRYKSSSHKTIVEGGAS